MPASTLALLMAVAGGGALVVGMVLAASRTLLRPALLVQAAGVLLIGMGGAAVWLGGDAVGAAFTSGVGPAVGIDRLSGFFLALLGVTGAPALVYAAAALGESPAPRALAMLTGGFVAAMAGVLVARDVILFLLFWELMTLLPASAILVARRDSRVRRAAFVYLAMTHLGGVGVWLSLLLLAHAGAIGDPAALAADPGLRTPVALLALAGFATKAGLMPVHGWLPRAHPVAPPHISALMSGMMLKVALYGLIRVLFEWLGPEPAWLGLALLALGLLSALGGVTYAIVQRGLKPLLAFSSIENVGIMVLGLGASLLFQGAGRPAWAAIAFGAALMQMASHAVFKSLLFLGAGSFNHAVADLHLDRLGGLLRRMPWTGGAFAVGAMAIAGLPPLNGFASEWLTLQALLHLAVEPAPGLGFAGAIATAGLAATAALALFCFVKVVGLVLLGPARRPAVAAAVEAPRLMRAPAVLLAGICVALGLAPGLVLGRLVDLVPGSPSLPLQPGLAIPGTGSLPALGIGVALAIPGTGSLPALGIGVALVFLTLGLVVARGRRVAPVAPVWACGQRVEPSLAWPSAGFTKPLRLVLEVVLRPERSSSLRVEGEVVQGLAYAAEVPHLFDTILYRPLLRSALAGATVARRLQSGSLRAYLAYLFALVLLLLGLVRLGFLG